jgi:hypothetical protein
MRRSLYTIYRRLTRERRLPSEREKARRVRQIDRGTLRHENGLHLGPVYALKRGAQHVHG